MSTAGLGGGRLWQSIDPFAVVPGPAWGPAHTHSQAQQDNRHSAMFSSVPSITHSVVLHQQGQQVMCIVEVK